MTALVPQAELVLVYIGETEKQTQLLPAVYSLGILGD